LRRRRIQPNVLTDRYRVSKLAAETGPPVPWEKQFDRDDALQRAQRVFWKSGYERSSMNMLLKGMGIQKGSFYATFRSKHHVLVETLQLYIDQRFASFRALSAKAPPLVALRRHLDEVVEESTGPDRFMGCFLVNCATELAPEEPGDSGHRDEDAAGARRLLSVAAGTGEGTRRSPAGFRYGGTEHGATRDRPRHARVRQREGPRPGTIRTLRQQAEMILAAGR
jgi:AcrR family transcriptional regulator